MLSIRGVKSSLRSIIPGIKGLVNFKTLILDNYDGKITEKDCRQLTNLTALKVSMCYQFPMNHLSLLTKLTVLSVRGPVMKQELFNSTLQTLSQLTYLNVESAHKDDLTVINQLTKLQYLDVSGCKTESFSFLNYCTNLKFLSMNHLLHDNCNYLPSLFRLNLLSLSITGITFPNNTISGISTLKSLDFNGKQKSVIKDMPSLEYVNVWEGSDYKWNETGKELIAKKYSCFVQSFTLHGNNIQFSSPLFTFNDWLAPLPVDFMYHFEM